MINHITGQKSAKRITYISMGALILGHMMINKFFPNILLNAAGLFLTSFFIYFNTLRKNDVFSFIMVIYFCSLFPYLQAYGGGFNLVVFVNILFYFAAKQRMPYDYRFNDKWLNRFAFLLILSSILGWFTNFAGAGLDIFYSILSFGGVIFLLLVSSRIIITPERVKIFLQLNFVLIIYSTIASINKYVKIITFYTPMMPIYGSDTGGGYIEGGGIIGSSPLYGEHSMILIILFTVFLILGNKKYGSDFMLSLGVFLSFINVFMSISRSVFMLSLAGVVMIVLLQFRVTTVNLVKQIRNATIIVILGIVTLWVAEYAGLKYVFNRLEEIDEKNKAAGGISIDRIIDGSAFNRETAFEEGYRRYASKESWIIGYGWGVGDNNRIAFYVDPTILRGSAHSQIFAILFILGWIGFIAYFGLYLLIIKKSFTLTGNNAKTSLNNRLFAYFSVIMSILFLFNEIKADSISLPYYFGSTIILVGLAYANLNTVRYLSVQSRFNIIRSSTYY
jgi:hypothetical protein